jgi:hypothetical protein
MAEDANEIVTEDVISMLTVTSAISRILGLDVRLDGFSTADTSMFWDSPLEHGPVPVTYSSGCVGIEWCGLCDDPEAVSKVELRDAESKLHQIILWCRSNNTPLAEYGKPLFTRKRQASR